MRIASASAVLASMLLLHGCTTGTWTEDLFTLHEIETGLAAAQTVVPGAFLGGDTVDLAVVRVDDATPHVRVYALDGEAWTEKLDAPLRDGIVFVDVAAIDGDDRLITYADGMLSWFDPAQRAEHGLLETPCDFDPKRADVVHLDVSRDVNGDGRDDLVVPDGGGFWVATQLDDGVFGEPVKLGQDRDRIRHYDVDGYRYDPWRTGGLHVTDFDGDGALDLVSWTGESIDVHHQDEAGRFGGEMRSHDSDVTFDSDDPSYLAAPDAIRNRRFDDGFNGKIVGRVLHTVTDVDGDGVVDLVGFGLEGRSMFWWETRVDVYAGAGQPDGTVTFATEADTSIVADGIPFDWQRCDIDGDGQQDVMIRRFDPDLFAIAGVILTSSVTTDLLFYRMDDGRYQNRPDAVRKVKAKGIGESGERASFQPAVMLGDVDGDGRLDLLVQRGEDELQVYLGEEGDDLFARAPFRVTVDVPADEEFTWLVDLNQDGKQDVIMHHASPADPHRVSMLIAK